MQQNIDIKKVTDKKIWTADIYKYDPAWVPPVIKDQLHFFDTKE